MQEIDIDVDYYWTVDNPYNLNYDLEIETPKLLTGSFIDDWYWLQKILNDKNPPTTLDLERLGNVMKIVSDSISKSRKLII